MLGHENVGAGADLVAGTSALQKLCVATEGDAVKSLGLLVALQSVGHGLSYARRKAVRAWREYPLIA